MRIVKCNGDVYTYFLRMYSYVVNWLLLKYKKVGKYWKKMKELILEISAWKYLKIITSHIKNAVYVQRQCEALQLFAEQINTNQESY